MIARRTLASTLALSLAAPVAVAGPTKILVLQPEGRADGKVRAKVHGAVLKLAKTGGAQVSPGDITYAEAAAAVGCKPEAAACREEVIGMLSVDEIVTITVTPKPGGVEVVVHRAGKSGIKESKTTVTADKADQLDAIGPLFGAAEPKPAPKPEPKTEPKPEAKAAPKPEPKPVPVAPTPPPPPPEEPAPPPSVAETTPPPAEYIVQPHVDRPKDRSTLYLGGMAAGATMVVVGAVLWAKASSIQSEIDTAPTATRGDLEHLQALEADGDSYAGWGNVLAIGGLVVGGASTYLYFRNKRMQRSRTAVTPLVVPGGGGIAITFGGSR